MVETERGFFDDFDHPYFLVSLIPVGSRQSESGNFGGTALNQLGRGDFINLLKWAGNYLNESSARTQLLENPKVFTVKFKDYDWSLNIA